MSLLVAATGCPRCAAEQGLLAANPADNIQWKASTYVYPGLNQDLHAKAQVTLGVDQGVRRRPALDMASGKATNSTTAAACPGLPRC